MKRPLCALALILTAAVWLYLELFYSDIMAESACMETEGSYVTVLGQVSGKELSKNYTGDRQVIVYVVPVDKGSSDSRSIQCYLNAEVDSSLPAIGTFVRISGRVKLFSPPTNPGEFDSRLYYTTLKIKYRLMDAEILSAGGSANIFRENLWRLKLFLGASLDAALPPEDAGIMKAMLLGDKSSMDKEIQEQFKAAGIVHILAISGTHIAILGVGLYEALRRLFLNMSIMIEGLHIRRRSGYNRVFHIDRLGAAFAAIIAMYSYGVMCGMGSSAFRAILMFSLHVIAPVVGRTYDILSALALAEILLLLEQPLYLYNSGFLMSFGAVVGIIVIRPALAFHSRKRGKEMRFVDDKKDGSIGKVVLEGLSSSVAIGIATLPVYALFYYTYPIHSLVINLLVIPAMGVLLTMGVVCMALGGLALGGGGTLIHMATTLPAFGIHVILQAYKAMSSLSVLNAHFTWYMGHSTKWQVVAYILLIGVFVLISDIKKIPNMLRFCLLAAAVVLVTLRIPSDLSIHAIDVDQGDSILISSAGHNLLIDGGSTSKKNVGKYRIIPFLKYQGIGRLDAVVATHEDDDHISGILEIMDDMEKGGIRIDKLILPEVAESSRGDNYHLLEKRAGELKIPALYINSGESFGLGKVSFTCLNPELGMHAEGANEYSAVLYMEYGEFTALFTGDMEGAGLEYVKAQLKSLGFDTGTGNGRKAITLLKVPHRHALQHIPPGAGTRRAERA